MKISSLLSTLFCAVALAAPTQLEWTYLQAFDYAISMGGPLEENIVAKVIKRHVESNKLSWSSSYSDITTIEGAVLNLAPELRRREPQISQSDSQKIKKALEKRALPIHITGYIWTNNCSNTWFKWTSLNEGCVSYVINGQKVRMYSIKIENNGWAGKPMQIEVYRNSGICGGWGTGGTDGDWDHCYAPPDGRGFMSFWLYTGPRCEPPYCGGSR